jgi:hypothetical protein
VKSDFKLRLCQLPSFPFLLLFRGTFVLQKQTNKDKKQTKVAFLVVLFLLQEQTHNNISMRLRDHSFFSFVEKDKETKETKKNLLDQLIIQIK